ncbi:hypothetical protein BWQ96_09568 [Gracilariopsis chorda]|uniref:Uncharacterized protein n=1 Tax=Gracilariopsis chorda TaxID=448386 RepID=A0A2V3IF70_9FLOR|nr:hypothetical protein BWQ96_09568 [Gracilariopsis chorda]|eukprot:PXF40735.1 hypothetical protein BWQ96_09568 [Gracilariopsis chorda]
MECPENVNLDEVVGKWNALMKHKLAPMPKSQGIEIAEKPTVCNFTPLFDEHDIYESDGSDNGSSICFATEENHGSTVEYLDFVIPYVNHPENKSTKSMVGDQNGDKTISETAKRISLKSKRDFEFAKPPSEHSGLTKKSNTTRTRKSSRKEGKAVHSSKPLKIGMSHAPQSSDLHDNASAAATGPEVMDIAVPGRIPHVDIIHPHRVPNGTAVPSTVLDQSGMPKKNSSGFMDVLKPEDNQDIGVITPPIVSKSNSKRRSGAVVKTNRIAAKQNLSHSLRATDGLLPKESQDTDVISPHHITKKVHQERITRDRTPCPVAAPDVVHLDPHDELEELPVQQSDLERGILHVAKTTAGFLNDALGVLGLENAKKFSPIDFAVDMQTAKLQVYKIVLVSLNLLSVNIFVLLSKQGDFLLPASKCKARFQWSSTSNWCLPSIQRNGYPYEINNWKAVFERLISLEKVPEYEYASAKAVVFGINSIRDVQKEKDWDEYVKWRFLLLQTSGKKILGRMLRSRSTQHVGVPLKDRYGPLNEKNSCAIDCLLFVFPHLFWELARFDLFGCDSNGNSLALSTPGCIVFQYVFQEMFRIASGHLYRSWVHKRISSYLRVLIQDLGELYSIARNRVPRMWFPCADNEFINLHEVLAMLLPRLLGFREVITAASQVSFLVVQLTSGILSEIDTSASLAEVIHKKLCSKDLDDKIGCVVATVSFGLGETVVAEARERLLGSSHYECRGITTSVLAYIGYSTSSKKTHFIAGKLFNSKDGSEHIYIYDGLKQNGKPLASSLQNAFRFRKGKFDIDGLVAIAVRRT